MPASTAQLTLCTAAGGEKHLRRTDGIVLTQLGEAGERSARYLCMSSSCLLAIAILVQVAGRQLAVGVLGIETMRFTARGCD